MLSILLAATTAANGTGANWSIFILMPLLFADPFETGSLKGSAWRWRIR